MKVTMLTIIIVQVLLACFLITNARMEIIAAKKIIKAKADLIPNALLTFPTIKGALKKPTYPIIVTEAIAKLGDILPDFPASENSDVEPGWSCQNQLKETQGKQSIKKEKALRLQIRKQLKRHL